MRYRTFGRTGWQVSEIAFGGWQIGGDWGTVDDDASIATLHHAFEAGINFVDTAELYGAGHSEEVVGRAVESWHRAQGSKVYVATKVQPIRWPDPDDDEPQLRGRFPSWYLRESVDAALRRLRTERIDLLQLHSWAPSGLVELDWLETLHALRVAGKIDHVGISLRDYRPDEGIDAARFGTVDSQQVVFNLFEQRPAERLFPAGRQSQTAFIARVPFDSGSLVGHWTADTYAGWAEGSVPHTLFRGERFGETLRRVEALKAVCAPYYATLAEAALRFTLSCPEVATVIPGITRPADVDVNVAYADGAPFPADLREQLLAHGWPRNFYQ